MLFKELHQLSLLFSKNEKWKLVILFVIMGFASILEAISIGIIPLFVTSLLSPQTIYDYLPIKDLIPEIPEQATGNFVLWASLALLAFIFLKSAFLLFVNYAQSRIITHQRVYLSDLLFRTYQKAPYDWLTQRNSSELQRKVLLDTRALIDGVIVPCLDLVLAIGIAVAVSIAIVMSTPWQTLLSLLLIGSSMFAITKLLQKTMKRLGAIRRDQDAMAIKAFQQGFGAIADARIIGCEEHLAKTYHHAASRYSKAHQQILFLSNSTPIILEGIAIIGLLLTLYLLILAEGQIMQSLPILSAVAVATVRLKQQSSKIADGINRINSNRVYIPSIIQDLQQIKSSIPLNAIHETSKSSGLIKDFKNLKVIDVSYSYPNTNQSAVKSISLELNKGESIAFVGKTGCGKSTLASLILNLLQPQSGEILVNDINIRKDPEGWRKMLGYIPQSIFLLDESIRANIAFGVPEEKIDNARLQSSIESAALKEFVNSLPLKTDTVIGERGIRLSGGQRQRIGIARALYFNPEVLVMDEATSALDNETESEVMQAIQNIKKEHALIMIAHRLSTIKDCNQIYKLDKT